MEDEANDVVFVGDGDDGGAVVLDAASTPTQTGRVELAGTAPSSGRTQRSQASAVTNDSAPAVNRFSIMRRN